MSSGAGNDTGQGASTPEAGARDLRDAQHDSSEDWSEDSSEDWSAARTADFSAELDALVRADARQDKPTRVELSLAGRFLDMGYVLAADLAGAAGPVVRLWYMGCDICGAVVTGAASYHLPGAACPRNSNGFDACNACYSKLDPDTRGKYVRVTGGAGVAREVSKQQYQRLVAASRAAV